MDLGGDDYAFDIENRIAETVSKIDDDAKRVAVMYKMTEIFIDMRSKLDI